MKVCYNSVFWDGTGYSVAAIGTALGLDSAGVDVVCRNIKLATQSIEPPNKIKELASKNLDNVDIVISHILPPYLTYHSGFINIGYSHFETDKFKSSNWQYYLNLMDAVLVSCQENKEACIKSGVKKPIHVIPIPTDESKYNKKYSKLNIPYDNKYIFYHIGDFSSRKNVKGLIDTYLSTFSKSDNVLLILKSYVENTNGQESAKIIADEINKSKQSLRRFNIDAYPPIIVLPEYLSDEQVMSLHAYGDCFISCERGAAWNIPAHDAASFGNWVICTGWGGQTQFIKNNLNGNLINYRMAMVSGMDRCPYNTLYTCNELWADPDLIECGRLMRECYESKKKPDSNTVKNIRSGLGLLNAGNEIKRILEEIKDGQL